MPSTAIEYPGVDGMGWYILFGALAFLGAFCLLWVLYGWLLPGDENAVLILPGIPGERELSGLRRFLWMRDTGLFRGRLIVKDLGLDSMEKARLEALGIEIYSPEALPDGLGIGANEIDGTGNGDPSGHHRRGGVPEL